ncbi:methylglyoxal synthase [Microbulbifer sp. OS29]|uniref:Methylglyoxal synthase n=1 Tax=Microbulbifer okhotskensis TaxID=2926617 RepID=A0A9X2EKF9_9GAMM|nr:methylglyoxal synthase [Microbulbifer okhotskensis]MCO1333235.1 methylglyoxal synthase [Microbulbifer okhotskensis]
MEFISKALPARKRVALVAHDNRKKAMIQWCLQHRDLLTRHTLLATGTTGGKIEEATGLDVEKLLSGPLGGDQQLGAKISEGQVDLLIFFWDPFEPMPHDPDVKALLRIAAAWNIPVACNQSSADMMVRSPLMNQVLERDVPDYQSYLAGR